MMQFQDSFFDFGFINTEKNQKFRKIGLYIKKFKDNEKEGEKTLVRDYL